ncbi:hypothetical protein [Neobacillus cucumis]|uniref:hypothetical protein n=1 Tax=Neobacillus cucumis TaxID=1740721 RepID=UPI0015E0FAA0|nr:hypothetical protein [Neobacillus cucumis]
MNKRAIGALTMVLVGSVTFSLTNNLLADQSIKQLTQPNNLPISDEQKTAVQIDSTEKNINQSSKTADEITTAKNTVVEQKPVTETNTVKTTVLNKPVTQQAKSKNTATQIQKNTTTVIVTSSSSKPTASVATTTQNQKTTAPMTQSTKPTTTGATSTKTTTTTASTTSPTTTATTNHGQQVSQDAKAKAAINKAQKVTPGKKK